MKLTEIIKKGDSPLALIDTASPEEMGKILLDFGIIARIRKIADEVDLTSDTVKTIPDDVYYDLVKIIDSVFHKKDIVWRSVCVFICVKCLAEVSSSIIHRRIARKIMEESSSEIIEKLKKVDDEIRKSNLN